MRPMCFPSLSRTGEPKTRRPSLTVSRVLTTVPSGRKDDELGFGVAGVAVGAGEADFLGNEEGTVGGGA